jgi:transmembrane sensor
MNGLAATLEACYPDIVRQLTRSTGCPDRARELAHDIWLKLVCGAPHAAEVGHTRAYLLSAAQHLAVDGVRRGQRHDIVVDDLALRATLQAPDVADQVAHRQALQAVERALAALPQRTRQVFLAHRLDGTGHDELAAQHGVSRSAVERDLQRAQAAVQQAIEHWHNPRSSKTGRTPPTSRRRSLGALLGVAGLVGGTWLLWGLWQQQVPQWQAAFATPRGRMARHSLPDGSELTLDADSGLQATYYGGRRELRLLRGAAFFAVAHDAARPFSVQAAGTLVTVLGTRFSVELEGSGSAPVVRVAVQSGRVRVLPDPAAPGGPIDLGAGDALSITRDAAGGAPTLHQGRAPAAPWREGWLSFSHTPLGEAAGRINRYRSTPLQVHPGVAALPVSGEVRIAAADEWLHLLPQALPVQVQAGHDGGLQLLPR